MWAVACWWGFPLTFDEVSKAGLTPLVRWQIDYIGPLPISEGYQYAVTCVDTATGLLGAFLACCADQQTTKRGLEHLFVAYGRPQVIESDQGTHFTGHALQEWVQQLGIMWKFHVPYNPTGAGMREVQWFVETWPEVRH